VYKIEAYTSTNEANILLSTYQVKTLGVGCAGLRAKVLCNNEQITLM